eukprot:1157585-Pelagomonas_calceolata.AAC.1
MSAQWSKEAQKQVFRFRSSVSGWTSCAFEWQLIEECKGFAPYMQEHYIYMLHEYEGAVCSYTLIASAGILGHPK